MVLNKIRTRFVVIFNSFYYRLIALKRSSWISVFAELRIYPGACFNIGRRSRVTRGSIIHVYDDSKMDIGDDVWIGPYNIIYCQSSILISNRVRVSHFCTITDNDYVVSRTNNERINFQEKRCSRIKVGENSWLCANSTILRGSIISSHTVVGPGVCVKRKIS